MRNLFVTGIPRAGTTLAGALIDSLEDAVCLSEPEWQDAWPRQMHDADEYAQRLFADFERVRDVLQRGDSISDRRREDGRAISNYFPRTSTGRMSCAHAVPFRREGLGAQFLLGMKQNAHYTCIVDRLVDREDFAVLAIIRNPVDTLSSWNSLSLPISEGRLPAAERFWPQIAEVVRVSDDILTRQVLIYQLFCLRYRALRRKLTILRYEDMVANPALISEFAGRKFVRDVQIRKPDSTSLRATQLHERIRACISAHCPIAMEFYPELSGGVSPQRG